MDTSCFLCEHNNPRSTIVEPFTSDPNSSESWRNYFTNGFSASSFELFGADEEEEKEEAHMVTWNITANNLGFAAIRNYYDKEIDYIAWIRLLDCVIAKNATNSTNVSLPVEVIEPLYFGRLGHGASWTANDAASSWLGRRCCLDSIRDRSSWTQ